MKDPQRHRFIYQNHLWRGDDMLGLGVASFGYFDGVHYQNESSLETYEAALALDNIPAKRVFPLSSEDRVVREFILQLKLGHVPSEPFMERYGVDIAQRFQPVLCSLEAEGFLACDESSVHLTRAGLLRVDRLLPLFYDPRYRDQRYS